MLTTRCSKHLALCFVAASLLFGLQAQGAIVNPITPGHATWTTDINSNLTAAELDAIVTNNTLPLSVKYKQDVGAANDSGTFSSSYTTTFANSASDPADALIKYVAGEPVLLFTEMYLIVKDGNQTPAQYIFDLVAMGWNGTDDLNLEGFWPDKGAISHVEIRAGGDPIDPPGPGPTPTPEPATLAIWGLGLGIAGLVRLRRKA